MVNCLKVVIFIIILVPTFLNAKVYDCFLFFNEIELLKMRLYELDPVVDYFVLVESRETFSGRSKSLLFKENRHLFEKYLHKIIYVEAEPHPELTSWPREYFQRNCILRGLRGCVATDIVMISDLDEIPRPSVISETKKLQVIPGGFVGPGGKLKNGFALQQSSYFFQLNRQTATGRSWYGGHWVGTAITTYHNLAGKGQNGPQFYREQIHNFYSKQPSILELIHNAGWHFSWMGGYEAMRKKVGSFAHTEVSHLENYSDQQMNDWVSTHRIVPINSTFPSYVLQNIDYLKSIGMIEEWK